MHLALSAVVLSGAVSLLAPMVVFSATTPALGFAATYGVLASTYTNTTAGTVITGDVGFTTGPAIAPGGAHVNYGFGAPYATAGTDQGTALAALTSAPCTFTFATGAINLSADPTHGTVGIYAPGVYCSTGAMNVGGALTLNGSGTYIFRPVGALDSTAGAIVSVMGGASACDVFWTPTGATTLAANTTFVGTVIGNAGVTAGANTTWLGRSLTFGGTVTSDTNTITVPTCAIAVAAPAAVQSPVVTPSSTPVIIQTPSSTVPVITQSPAAATSTVTVVPLVTVLAPTSSTATVVLPTASPVINLSTAPNPVAVLAESGVVADTEPITNSGTGAALIPTFPNTGVAPGETRFPWNNLVLVGIFTLPALLYVLRKKQIL